MSAGDWYRESANASGGGEGRGRRKEGCFSRGAFKWIVVAVCRRRSFFWRSVQGIIKYYRMEVLLESKIL